MKTTRILPLAAAALIGACGQDADAPSADAGAAAPAEAVQVTGFSNPESVVYDPEGDRYLVGNVGGFGPDNDGFISAVNPDGTIAELRFIEGSDDAPLANALGTGVHDGMLYVADSPYVRVFDLESREPVAAHMVENAGFLNDLEVAADGTVYVSDMGSEEPESWRVIQISPDGTVSVFAEGEALQRPNGLEIDNDGRIVLGAVAAPMLVMLSPDSGEVEQTITLPDGGYDGVVILDDGYIVSDPFGPGIYRVGLDGESTLISDTIEQPASLGYDDTRNVVLVPQLQQNAITLLPLGD